ncbi:SRPBCC family protein [Pseudomonas sp. HK3]
MFRYEVRRSTTIKAPCADIIEYLSDFTNWPTWSPWLILEPSCPVEYYGEQKQIGAGYSWNGDMIGAGSMLLIDRDTVSLDMALEILRPFPSKARVRFEILQSGNSSVLTWIMTSQLPWYLIFMKSMIKNWITMDYDRGLLMLQSQLETGSVLSTPSIIGEHHQPKVHYIALKGRATIPKIGQAMQSHMARLNAYFEANRLSIDGPLFCLYEYMDKSTTESEFFTCFPVAHSIDIEPPFVCDTLEACDTFVVQHKGAYRFMGNAWALAITASRHQKMKIQNKPMGIERYWNHPGDHPETDLLTDVILFKK